MKTPQVAAMPGMAPLGLKKPEPPKIVRKFSAIGPCLMLGRLTKETPTLYVFEGRSGERKAVRKQLPGRYSRHHTEPCRSCGDHPQTQYPDGYMD